jgi:DNA excision repair protein ERCC-2
LKERHAIAVRTLVDVVLRAGDLDMRFTAPGRPIEGIRAHQNVQRQRGDGYRAEVPVAAEVETDDLILLISGRIDGVLETDSLTMVEEIKSTTRDLAVCKQSPDPCHWAQARVYACLFARSNDLDAVLVRLTYCHLDTGETLELENTWTREELEAYFQDLIERYIRWAAALVHWRQCRDTAIRSVAFPFTCYRAGQRDMAVAVYRTVRDSGQALIQASTGIGKTMAAVFPAVKAIADGHADRIFFLTARNTAQASAIQALNRLQDGGLRLRRVCLTAKDRICFCPEATCNPEACAFAKGHFDRLPSALDAAFIHDNLTRETIEAVARSHRVCPFELSLELSRWADCIIADYNYAFDPRVYLKRFFDDEHGAYVFLVDEAHNLVDRSREMFSAQLSKNAFLDLRRAIKAHLPAVYRTAGKINTWMLNARRQAQDAGSFDADERLPDGLEPLLRAFSRAAERWLARNEATPYREIVLDRYFEVSGFLRVWDQFDGSYVTCRQAAGKELLLKLFCLDPSGQLRSALKRSRASIFFSATLTPAGYFQKILGCEPTAVQLAIPSPFPTGHLGVFIATSVSTYYAQREKSIDRIVSLIHRFIQPKAGNYLCFFPSYAYMNMAAERLAEVAPEAHLLVQARDMDDAGRACFLDHFSAQNTHTLVGSP